MGRPFQEYDNLSPTWRPKVLKHLIPQALPFVRHKDVVFHLANRYDFRISDSNFASKDEVLASQFQKHQPVQIFSRKFCKTKTSRMPIVDFVLYALDGWHSIVW